MRIARLIALSAALLAPAAVAACGARTGLPAPDPPVEQEDAGPDAPPEAAPDAPPDVVLPNDCVDAGTTFIYLITSETELFSFYPPSLSFHDIGPIDCPGTSSSPFSMGVARGGTARVVYQDGQLFEVSTATATCKPTFFVPDQEGFHTFGMGFSTDENGPSEKLFVSESNYQTPSEGLAFIDLQTYELNYVAPFSPDPGVAVELTGTGDGRLYGFFIQPSQTMSVIAQIDKTTGELSDMQQVSLGVVEDFAFAFWGGDFYLFHSDNTQGTTVTRYSPSDGSLTDVASMNTHVVGAGVTTCAPE